MTNAKAAELLAAVRAVESGERSAASFFAEPAQPQRPQRPQHPQHPQAGERGAPASAGGPGARHGAAAPRPPVPAPDELLALLREGGAPQELGRRVAETLGEGAAELLRDDPWKLLAVPGVRPEQADGFARALLGGECGPDDPRRTEALVVWLLGRAALAGHTAQDPAELARALAGHSVADPEEAVRGAVETGAVLVFEDALDAGPAPAPPEESEDEADRPVRMLVGLDSCALAEESLADGLARLVTTFAPEADEAAGRDGAAWSRAAAAAPSASAGELITAAARHGLVAHTGGEAARAEPAALLAAARALGLRAYAATHTGNGRARLAELLPPGTAPGGDAGAGAGPGADGAAAADPGGREAGEADPAQAAAQATDAAAADVAADAAAGEGMAGASDGAPGADEALVTVSGLLTGSEGPGRDEDGAWELDLLIVCDAPQLDTETAAALVESLRDGARLVLSGDPLQLGSAGPGQVFRDLLAARFGEHIASRTPDPGPLGELVSGIGIGELPQVEAPEKEVVIVPVQDAGEAVHRSVQLLADSVPRAIGVPPERTQVITPGHGGAAGTRALNAALKERLNPGPGRFGGFDPGDRVAHSPVPGRTVMGTVVSADEAGLRLDCAGRTGTVPRERVAETVRHGWAVTAHQAAGMRWPAAVVVLPGDAAGALSREWVYTAFGRGERHLSVVHGAGEALPRAVAADPGGERVTRLRTLLGEASRAQAAPQE
ncbi:helix-hairpin-helix domain-containing protein [Streptomyces boncukensis]|uniref:AAA family ATPase n=1 Tax=Streptomyces boncukensis TaxID=2711219 RepID=A0A6G4WRJ7_9ACTN|nr:AAA family ATPase [Streptomyces boncukensis]